MVKYLLTPLALDNQPLSDNERHLGRQQLVPEESSLIAALLVQDVSALGDAVCLAKLHDVGTSSETVHSLVALVLFRKVTSLSSNPASLRGMRCPLTRRKCCEISNVHKLQHPTLVAIAFLSFVAQ